MTLLSNITTACVRKYNDSIVNAWKCLEDIANFVLYWFNVNLSNFISGKANFTLTTESVTKIC